MLDIAFHDFVPQDVRREINRIANMFVGHHAKYMGPRINVIVTNTMTVSFQEGRRAIGVFVEPAILVAGRCWPAEMKSRKDQVAQVGDTFAHELIHLEQWLLGETRTERGLESRVKRIRAAGKWVA